jgi:hypothetical protein
LPQNVSAFNTPSGEETLKGQSFDELTLYKPKSLIEYMIEITVVL